MSTIPVNTDSSSDAILELLFKLKVKDVMTSSVLTASPDNTIREIQLLMKRSRVTGVPVVEGRSLVGIISMEDIVNAFDGGWINEKVEDHMTRNVIVMQESMPVSFCVSYFNKYRFGRFPVIDNQNKLVGIVTTTDVISSLLAAMNTEVERLESAAQFTPPVKEPGSEEPNPNYSTNSTDNEKIFIFKTEPFNFEKAGLASTEIKKQLKAMKIDPAITRRIGIASYELEINQVVHSEGGVMRYVLTPDKLIIEATDVGPGIPDIQKALTEGFFTATDKVRAFGFGAGMGLPNTKRVSDDFDITSSKADGTTVRASFNLTYLKDGSQ